MLYGTGIVLIILIGTLLSDLTQVKDSCFWMCIAAAVITPITWEDLEHFKSFELFAELSYLFNMLLLLIVNEMRGKDGNTQGLLAHGSGVVSLHPGSGGHMHRTVPDRPRVGGKASQGIFQM